jgi:hypothetical protein
LRCNSGGSDVADCFKSVSFLQQIGDVALKCFRRLLTDRISGSGMRYAGL